HLRAIERHFKAFPTFACSETEKGPGEEIRAFSYYRSAGGGADQSPEQREEELLGGNSVRLIRRP
ncbi:hypothetical protein DUP91_28455, partial [Salmonella enterica subsp. enterica]|nr:hypothetical protein [Salmonella enterica subsp. enterica]